MRILKRDNQLHLFRRLEQCSKKQINCNGSIEFLRLCEDFDLTPTFAKVDQDERRKWKHSSEIYTKNFLAEELRHKKLLRESLKLEVNTIYYEIRKTSQEVRSGSLGHSYQEFIRSTIQREGRRRAHH